jgi:molecular chaperone GrpE
MHCLGEKFDPHKHEAVMQVELADQPEGTVVEEVRKGYQAGARVIRPAMVKVSKKPAEKEEEKPEDKEEKDKENG